MSRALVVTQPDLDASRLVGLARSISDEVHAIVVADAAGSAIEEPDTDGTTAIGGPVLETAEGVADALVVAVAEQGADIIVLPATHRFREITALLTARLDGACAPETISACRSSEGITADRLAYGGVAIVTVLLQRAHVLLTAAVNIRAAASGSEVAVEPCLLPMPAGKELMSRVALDQTGDLSSAERIVSFGRGVRSREDVAMIDRLSEALGADLGCSRPIVEDLRWLELPHQVGLTGTTVKPALYFAVGISGQIQHLVGMRDSKYIVAINNNPNAPIFEASDLAVVGDLYEIVPRLVEALAARTA
jgi:electron transfer flavoprotein alpha subunit